MKNLVIVESPSKSKTIEKYLGKDYKVVSSVGHIRDLATSGKGGLGIDIENDFSPTYKVSTDKKAVVKDLKKLAGDAENVFLATDPDREGEAISWHLFSELKLEEENTKRVVFNEITKTAVLKAFETPRTIDMSLVKSQETRRMLDRIIGFKLSSLLKSKIRSKSAGRVQSVALRMICDKEDEINKFISEEYWEIDADFKKDEIDFKAKLSKVDNKKVKVKNETEAKAIYDRLQDEFTITNIKKQSKKRAPKLPFTTSTLQQESSTKLNFSAKKTMMVAQKLYEGIDLGSETLGLITYMRTDSTRLSDSFVISALSHIEEVYGKNYKGSYKVKKNSNAQDAHEGIRPTNVNLKPEDIKDKLTNDQYKLYHFIYYRTLASLMASVINDTVSVTLNCNDIELVTNGSIQVFDGFLKVYRAYDGSKDVILPELSEKEILKAIKVNTEQCFTEPPSRYTEAKLIKAMEEEGIGRPSTYSSIVDTIQARGYVELKTNTETSKTKYFFPSDQGILTDSKLQEYFSSVINIKYTANMEKELDLIADDKLDNIESLKKFYSEFEPLVANAYENMEKLELEKTGELCPLCEGELVYRQGRFGKFISCINYPTCKHTAKIPNPNKEEPEPSGIMCPDCGKELLKRKSRYGNYFLGCSGFPKCRHIQNIEGQEKPKYIRKKKK